MSVDFGLPNDGGSLDLFCGAGGLTLGLQLAGIDVIAGVDYDEAAIETYRTNFDHRAIQCNLAETAPSEFADEHGIYPVDVDTIGGGPPCQGFSTANHYRDADDERNNLVFIFADYVDYYEPDTFLMENVPGITSIDDGALFDRLLAEFRGSGHTVDWAKLNAADYGVPQKRERVFVQGHRSGKPTWPAPTHVDGHSHMAVEDAIGHLPSLEAGEGSDAYPNHRAPNHQQKTVDRVANTDWGEPLYDSWRQMIRLHPREPSPTVMSGGGSGFKFGHPHDDRGLTIRERAALQTFPDDHEFCGTKAEQFVQTGNAVPVELVTAAATAMRGGEGTVGDNGTSETYAEE